MLRLVRPCTLTNGAKRPAAITLSKEVRPVFFEELKFLALDDNFGWRFQKTDEPLCWAEGRRYFYR